MSKGKRGTFSEDQIKKMRKDEQQKILQEKKRSKKIQINCNHIDAKTGKSRLKSQGDGTHKCKLCKAVITTDPKILNSKNIEEAVEMLYSAISIVRHELNLKAKFDGELVTSMETINLLPEVFDEMMDKVRGKDKKREKKDDKHKNDKKRKKNKRVRY